MSTYNLSWGFCACSTCAIQGKFSGEECQKKTKCTPKPTHLLSWLIAIGSRWASASLPRVTEWGGSGKEVLLYCDNQATGQLRWVYDMLSNGLFSDQNSGSLKIQMPILTSLNLLSLFLIIPYTTQNTFCFKKVAWLLHPTTCWRQNKNRVTI